MARVSSSAAKQSTAPKTSQKRANGVRPSRGQAAQITVFGERHEIFAEHRLVVAGEPAKFATHVTDLETLEPRPLPRRIVMRPDAPAWVGVRSLAGCHPIIFARPQPCACGSALSRR